MKKTLILLFILQLQIVILYAQTVTGKLVDQTGMGLAGFQVELCVAAADYSATTDSNGFFTFNGVTGEETGTIPSSYSISNNYPNPFNPRTRFNISVPKAVDVRIELFNVLGQKVEKSIIRSLNTGGNLVDLDFNGLSNGIYYAKFTFENDITLTRKLMLLYGSQHLKSSSVSSGSNFKSLIKKSVTGIKLDSLIVTDPSIDKRIFVNLPLLTTSSLDLGNIVVTFNNSVWYDGIFYSSDSLKTWGMGNKQIDYFHNDCNYSWYIDQAVTGQSSNNNCGPASVTMAAKWYDKNFTETTEDARNTYYLNGGWWYTNNIIDYLNKYSISNITVQYVGTDQIASIIKNGDIAILCINTAYLTYNSNSAQRVDRFYSYSSGHFLVVKGIRTIDNKIYIEVYDPNNWYAEYSDNSTKGKNRHYRSEDLSNAIKNWWNYLIIVSRNTLNKFSYKYKVDPSTIENNWGK